MVKKLFLIVILVLLVIFVTVCVTKVLDIRDSKVLFTDKPEIEQLGPVKHKIALFADSHTNYDNLQKSIELAKSHSVDLIIHVGDLSDFGETKSYIKSKELLDQSEIKYVVIPGDRDMVENGTNFSYYFEDVLCDVESLKDYAILCLVNPYNYTNLSQDYIDTIKSVINNYDLVVAAQPIYNPGSNIYMGYYDDKVEEQSDILLSTLLSSGVSTFISGDTHFFKSFTHPQNQDLNFFTLGAITDDRNLETPNIAIVYIYDSGQVRVSQFKLVE